MNNMPAGQSAWLCTASAREGTSAEDEGAEDEGAEDEGAEDEGSEGALVCGAAPALAASLEGAA
jgi:hypothetical protein